MDEAVTCQLLLPSCGLQKKKMEGYETRKRDETEFAWGSE